MRILLAHNRYQQPGGEDVAFASELDLLRAHGHDVLTHVVDNHQLHSINPSHALAALWNPAQHHTILRLIDSFQPHLLHVHNFWARLSPSIFHAAARRRLPVVQTLHNFRLLCPGALLLRDGQPCNLCLESGSFTPALRHRCYRGSRAATFAVASMVRLHSLLGTWHRHIHRYIALTRFARELFLAGGLPEERVAVKPNPLSADPGPGSGSGDYALFAGRLSEEKGILLLLDAWHHLAGSGLRLLIAGDGPLAPEVRAAAATLEGLEYLGPRPRTEVLSLLGDARCLVAPSLCYESFPMVLVEAAACATPAIVAGHGGLAEIVQHQRTGLHFPPGDAAALAAALWHFRTPEARLPFARHARRLFETTYTPEANYEQLLSIYDQARDEAYDLYTPDWSLPDPRVARRRHQL